ncbi:protein NETWORKED 1D [Sesamum angolense]|uniref:Protein NETWORKED 1D n=1 Tax=Sesamum angolense TaxID=2727404 RepID=A0AAE2C3A7_9LAMI|nr:protein NETWORKED 1D [Sesamum angolense]
MANRSQTGWWESHISPKNSKWLQENLTDMDVKIKAMIMLIEVDEDSLARTAEMYYKKRPELMALLEGVYRGHRALAERYDQATSAIRYAHRTMMEAFPNQALLMFADDSPASDVSGLIRELLRCQYRYVYNNDEFTDESVEQSTHSNENNSVNDPKLSNQEGDSEEILRLKEALAKLETEKEAGLVQYRQSLDKLSQLEAEISKTREDFSVLSDRANKAENEAVISSAQEDAQKLNERANNGEIEAQSLKSEFDKLAVEKDAALNQYMQSLEIISNLENKLQLTEEDARGFKERAEKAESEVEILRQTISKSSGTPEENSQHSAANSCATVPNVQIFTMLATAALLSGVVTSSA